MSLAHSTDTVPAHPLGIPVDGRERYSMTREQAFVYQWLVKKRPHDGAFSVGFRSLALAMSAKHGMVYQRVKALIDRGWLERTGNGRYCFVHPNMFFKVPR